MDKMEGKEVRNFRRDTEMEKEQNGNPETEKQYLK